MQRSSTVGRPTEFFKHFLEANGGRFEAGRTADAAEFFTTLLDMCGSPLNTYFEA